MKIKIVLLIGLLAAANSVVAQRSTPVTITPSGNTVKVDTTANMVKIDPSNNTVMQRWSKIQPWDSNQVMVSGSSMVSGAIDLRGYKEMRVWLGSNSSSANVSVAVEFKSGDGSSYDLGGTFDFSATSNQLTTNPNYHPYPAKCIFTLPVMSDYAVIYIGNLTATNITIYKYSWVYLVN